MCYDEEKKKSNIKNIKTPRLSWVILKRLHEYSKLPTLIKLIIFMHIHTCSPLFHISRDYCFGFDSHLFCGRRAKMNYGTFKRKLQSVCWYLCVFPHFKNNLNAVISHSCASRAQPHTVTYALIQLHVLVSSAKGVINASCLIRFSHIFNTGIRLQHFIIPHVYNNVRFTNKSGIN